MFLFANKEKLRQSVNIDEHFYKSTLRGNLISGMSLAFASIGSIVMYFWFTEEASKTGTMLFVLIAFNLLTVILLLDHFLELKFLKALIISQSPENLFGEEEWLKIQEAAQRKGVSDKELAQAENVE